MASLIAKNALSLAGKRSFSVSCVATSKGSNMSDPKFHATGLEKYEILAAEAGNDDPFFLRAKHIVKATKEEPHIVDALDEYRMVGCLCNEHDTNIKWMWLFENKPKRCRCGHWFKLKKHAAPDRYEMPL
ncbi:cytochrome c oxidase subunit 5B, mitochondrial isoform X1 [Lepeophtheirus salmonis]|uniref:Cytochrome c oxidase subunit 5B, mitochondrial n=2 Tax=Lepeophtheirus salmonis TaxID=72036 RepID=C1BUC0_LEPSM|nr:cytochrome c oxidase subunit 5B, mitochondrial-like isoform X1 [Lepeophtheirus salmonis]ACO12623.1 Cytochrome c oxidase subunit 5B, mitochondrial precursor [Lepeophtheirus salmonis]ACO13019.1 Cytochrome c oxidase subunit 5B, mitochondrial precursor [Lepeophtheirus salmonis]ADD24276.1 Cytochrome c oxidase subunit 5B, mitochondrial [Lepeophtheirus salmonis]ADD37974.1 Cytochrome c oxidase subunit 5B, mitochondrial [Lepeophtheirus salmonis]